MQPGVPLDEVKAPTHEFFERAQARLNREVPPALTDSMRRCAFAAISISIRCCGTRPASRRPSRRPCWCRWSRGPEPAVLLTLRTPELRSHSGQIAFPGGTHRSDRREPAGGGAARGARGDRARRELRRADRLSRSLSDLLRASASCRWWRASIRTTGSSINPGEVADAFEVPLDFLMTPGNHQRLKRDWKGIERQYYAMPFDDRYIWGVTAGILRNLYERIYAG